ncbi:MAG: hypothetical protein LBJ02_05140, partial [Bifidobacteriaceae bacterium]|nr:hypothetical protein [Bifidobacteriaceae bacterium]
MNNAGSSKLNVNVLVVAVSTAPSCDTVNSFNPAVKVLKSVDLASAQVRNCGETKALAVSVPFVT